MPRFQGVPVTPAKKPRFGGTRVDAPDFSGVSGEFRAAPRKVERLVDAIPATGPASRILLEQGEDFARAAAHQAGSAFHGGAQAIEHGIGYLAERFAPESVAAPIRETIAADDAALRRREAEYQAQVPDSPGATAGAVTGAVAPFLLSSGRLGGTQTGNIAGRLGATIGPRTERFARAVGFGTTEGAVGSAAAPVLGDDFAAEKSAQVKAGTGVGGLVGGVAGALSRAPATGAIRQVAEKAEALGIPIRPSAAMDSAAAQRARSIPGTGARGRYEDDVRVFNEKLAETIGAPKGTPQNEVFRAAAKRNSAEYDDFAKNYPLTLSNDLLTRLARFRNTADMLSGAQPQALKAIDKFFDEAAQHGGAQVPGALFKDLDTALGQIPFNSLSYGARREVQGALRDAYRAGLPEGKAAAWDDLQRRYGDMQTLRALYAKSGGEAIDPRKVLNRVAAGKSGSQRMAMGTRGELGDLAEVGQRIRAPASMTVGDAVLPAGALAGTAMLSNPLAAAGLYGVGNIAGRFLDSPALARYLISGANIQPRAAGAAGAAAANSRQKKKD